MKLSKPLIHLRLDQCQYFYWDSRIDPREDDYDPDFGPNNDDGGLSTPSFFMICGNI
jgi:hypothetical protein